MKQTEAEKDGTIIRIDVLKKQYPKLYGELIEALAELYPQQQVKKDLIAGVVGSLPTDEEIKQEAELRYPVTTHSNPENSPYVGSQKTFMHGCNYVIRMVKQ
tara:strand:+ start:172 stop:477 length:306 start_codon:yes stop_codon:yes gene_type:complete